MLTRHVWAGVPSLVSGSPASLAVIGPAVVMTVAVGGWWITSERSPLAGRRISAVSTRRAVTIALWLSASAINSPSYVLNSYMLAPVVRDYLVARLYTLGVARVNNRKGTVMPGVRIAAHAVDQWINRVDHEADRGQAVAAILEVANGGRVRARLPSWIRKGGIFKVGPGQVLVTWHGRPDVALLVSADTVVTVWTRASGERHRERRRVRRHTEQPSHKPGRRMRAQLLDLAADEAWRDDG